MIDLFFQLLNFGIIVGLLVYGVIRFFIPLLKKGADHEKMVESNLHEDHRALLRDQKHVDESTVAQESDCVDFFNKINQWKSVVHKEMSQREIEQRRLAEEAQKKMQLQSHYHSQRLMYNKVAPVVADNLERDLKIHFEDENASQVYMQRLLKGLKSDL